MFITFLEVESKPFHAGSFIDNSISHLGLLCVDSEFSSKLHYLPSFRSWASNYKTELFLAFTISSLLLGRSAHSTLTLLKQIFPPDLLILFQLSFSLQLMPGAFCVCSGVSGLNSIQASHVGKT